MSDKDRAISLLGQGFGGSQVAAAIGVDVSLVSQWLADPVIRAQVAELRSKVLQQAAAADTKLEDIETRALQLVSDKLVFVKSPMEAARIYATLNGAKRKTAGINPIDDANATASVTITLPASIKATVQVQLNSANQVVDVNGRSMATLPSRALPSLVTDVTAKTSDTVPTARQITDAAADMHRKADKARAAKILENVKTLVANIDGVDCVL
jgi:NADH dehydrogenase/NADH:ubiquinone oxidoreductase subunit G